MALGFSHERVVNKSIEWYTPPEVFDALGIDFDLDPCSPGKGLTHVPAKNVFTEKDDGLSQKWTGTVFMNPPYGNQTKDWMDKFVKHGDGVALVFARTDTQWFQKHARDFDIVLFISGRIKFYQGDKNIQGKAPGAGSMLIGMGQESVDAIKQSGLGAYCEGLK